ncbi:MAG: hypothetical protein HY000_16180 [Planctomycetes bacterium]|nr:hypothetical protein [Planctomycetota bacterium]
MDAVLGTQESPTLEVALGWLTHGSNGQSVVVVSNHEEMLKAMWQAKKAGNYADQFARVCFVYLQKPKDRLARHMARPTAAGDDRPVDHQRYTLASYDRFHTMYTDLADYTINCAKSSIAEVVAEIQSLLERG